MLYDAGIGTDGPVIDKWVGGALGEGIDTNIKQLYSFLAAHYEDGDEVYMFGYSRGAYTVRSLAGLIHDCGLVGRGAGSHDEDQGENVDLAYQLYRRNLGDESEELRRFREENGERIPVELICCFDTVGALGVPTTLGLLNLLTRGRYQFHDIKLSAIIRNAIHLVALDEERICKFYFIFQKRLLFFFNSIFDIHYSIDIVYIEGNILTN